MKNYKLSVATKKQFAFKEVLCPSTLNVRVRLTFPLSQKDGRKSLGELTDRFSDLERLLWKTIRKNWVGYFGTERFLKFKDGLPVWEIEFKLECLPSEIEEKSNMVNTVVCSVRDAVDSWGK